MKKKYLMASLVIMATSMISACSNKISDNAQTIETEIETTTSETKETKNVIKENEIISTRGIYKSSDKVENINGEYISATFTDEHGNDFIATITEDTVVPNVLIKEQTYIVNHSGIMTRSMPGTYPEVYSIEEENEKIVIDIVNTRIPDSSECEETISSN